MNLKMLFVVLGLCFSLAMLSACGKKGALEPVDGGVYPKTYPAE